MHAYVWNECTRAGAVGRNGLVQAGSATAVTGGELLDAKKRPNSDDVAGSAIKGGTEQPLKPGDVLYVPHGFKDIDGFRAFLIRMDTK